MLRSQWSPILTLFNFYVCMFSKLKKPQSEQVCIPDQRRCNIYLRFNKGLIGTYYVLDPVLEAGDGAENDSVPDVV